MRTVGSGKMGKRNQNMMKKMMVREIGVFTAVMILLTACAGKTKDIKADSPQEAAEQVMNSIKNLDLETFNACTDNYEGICWNFIGLPAGKEYKVFNELLQPRAVGSRRYKEKYRFAEKVVEELEWKITGIQEEDGGGKARIQMTLTNRDMAEAAGRYTLWLMEDIIDDAGIGALSLAGNISGMLNDCGDDLIRFIDETESTWTGNVTVLAYKDGGTWKLQLTDEFINAFMGNIDSEEFPDEIEERLEELESESEWGYEQKLKQWADNLERELEHMW